MGLVDSSSGSKKISTNSFMLAYDTNLLRSTFKMKIYSVLKKK